MEVASFGKGMNTVASRAIDGPASTTVTNFEMGEPADVGPTIRSSIARVACVFTENTTVEVTGAAPIPAAVIVPLNEVPSPRSLRMTPRNSMRADAPAVNPENVHCAGDAVHVGAGAFAGGTPTTKSGTNPSGNEPLTVSGSAPLVDPMFMTSTEAVAIAPAVPMSGIGLTLASSVGACGGETESTSIARLLSLEGSLPFERTESVDRAESADCEIGAVSPTSQVRVSPLTRVPTVQVTVVLARTQPAGMGLVTVEPAGSSSTTVTPVASAGPSFVAENESVVAPPEATSAGENC
jgi:hypothetical protein